MNKNTIVSIEDREQIADPLTELPGSWGVIVKSSV